MFRARRFGRGVAGPRVRHAVRLLADGRYAEAGTLFGELADRALDRGQPLRSAHLAEQAGRAFLQAGDGERASLRVRQAIRQFVIARRPARAVRALQHAAAALRSRGFDAQASALEQEAQARLAEAGLSLASVPPETEPPHGFLPPTCPQCGGPLRADEVEWADAASAECPYCGSAVRTLSR